MSTVFSYYCSKYLLQERQGFSVKFTINLDNSHTAKDILIHLPCFSAINDVLVVLTKRERVSPNWSPAFKI